MLQYNSEGFCFQKKKILYMDVSFFCAFILHSDLKQKLILSWEPREKREDMHEPADNEYTAVGILLDNVGQTCGVHVSERCRLNPPLS